MCGGGGPSGETKYNWNDDMAPKWRNTLQNAESLASQPYQQYGGPRIAGFNMDQLNAIGYGRNIANMSSNPIPAMDAARSQITQTLGNDYLMGPMRNEAAYMSNRFSGDTNPYFQDVLKSGMDDITDSYQQGTAANTTRMFNLSGAFGGGAHQKAVANNEAALAKQLGTFSSGMLNDQYNRSAQLEESGLGRATGAFEGERGRQMSAIGAGQGEQGLAEGRLKMLMGLGDAQRGLQQDYYNLDFQNWQNQQNHPYQMMDWQTGLYSRAQGGMSPNSQFAQSGYSASPFSQLLGAGLLGYGMM